MPPPASAIGDEDLVLAVANGDRAALGHLYDRYAPVLLAVAQQVVGSRREAEDLVHDVFLEAWRHADEYDRGRGTVRTWLVMRARSRALDRRRSAGFSRVRPLADEPPPALDQTVPLEDPLLAPDRAAVRRALEALPPDQRAVLELGYFEGLSSSEMADWLAAPVGTIKSRVAAALAKLRSAFAELK